MSYRFVTEHVPGKGDKDIGENVHMVLKRTGKGKDKSGEFWDKFEVVAKFSTNDYDKPWKAKDAARKAYRRIKKWGE